MKLKYRAIAFAAAALVLGHSAWAGEAEAKKWVDSEFQPSTLSKDKQMAEMKWFIDAAKKLQAKGVKEISVVSETITTHEYESKTLAKAFTEITGITVKHDLQTLDSNFQKATRIPARTTPGSGVFETQGVTENAKTLGNPRVLALKMGDGGFEPPTSTV